MTPEFTPYVVAAWVMAVLAAFPSSRPHRAVLLTVLSGTLFLPEVGGGAVALGPIKLSKYLAISYAALLGVALYDSGGLFAPARRWFDWPMILWCLWPLPSALLNPPPPDSSAPLRDALSQTLNTAITWGAPYLLGRAYFGSRRALRDLAMGVVIAAAVYAPLCLWESRMSPNLHATVYGFAQHEFLQTIRFGGFRPMVFTPHGLCLAMFMVAATVLAVWMRKPLALPGYLLLLVPLCVLLRSTGALMLGVAGAAVLWLSRATGSRWWLVLLIAVPPAYVAGRTSGLWTGQGLVDWTSANIEEDRAGSLDFRLFHENMLIQKALEKPLTGWGGWGRARVTDEDEGKDISITDGLWVIFLGDRGLTGLALFGAAILLPVARFALRSDPALWHTPELAPATGCAVVLALWAINNLPNAMADPLWPLIAGGLAGLSLGDEPAPVDRA